MSNDLEVRPANWDDVKTVVKLLQKHDVKFFLVGGYALNAHGYTRMTEDIDIAVDPDLENSRRWVLAFSELPDQATKALFGEKDPFEGDYLHAIRINDEFTIDVMPSVAGHSFDELKKHTEHLATEEGISIPVLSLKGLLMTKQGLRPKDQADAIVIKMALQVLESSEEERLLSNDDEGI